MKYVIFFALFLAIVGIANTEPAAATTSLSQPATIPTIPQTGQPITSIFPGSDVKIGFKGAVKQQFVAPTLGVYEVTVVGADGGNGTILGGGRSFSQSNNSSTHETVGGVGQIIRGRAALTAGEILDVYVGGHGGNAGNVEGGGGGGGGGTFIIGPGAKPFTIAGGGGGAGYIDDDGRAGGCGAALATSVNQSDTDDKVALGGGKAGGNGNGDGAGGAGFYANGLDGSSVLFNLGRARGGASFANGLSGGKGAPSLMVGGGGDGGYGGGAGGGDSRLSGGGGGGGGYIGGNGGLGGVFLTVANTLGGRCGIGYASGLFDVAQGAYDSSLVPRDEPSGTGPSLLRGFDGFVTITLIALPH